MRKIILSLLLCPWLCQAEPLRICATTPDLGDLAKRIGGDEVEVTVFAKGVEDPHFVDARPSFIKAASRADLFIQIGMELELGWAPLLLEGARNTRLGKEQPGFIDSGTVIRPINLPDQVDRSMGDVHAGGNPHYLTDPENGRAVASLIADRLKVLRPEKAQLFDERFAAFSSELDGKLIEWTALLQPFKGTRFMADHDLWPYFAARFELSTVGFLEPKPGIAPTTRHLKQVIAQINSNKIPVLVTSSYYDTRHSEFVKEHTDVKIAPLAHQVGARPGTDDYISMLDYNVKQFVTALTTP